MLQPDTSGHPFKKWPNERFSEQVGSRKICSQTKGQTGVYCVPSQHGEFFYQNMKVSFNFDQAFHFDPLYVFEFHIPALFNRFQ